MAKCPLCNHPTWAHGDGVARRELDTMGCLSCLGCESNREALAVKQMSDATGTPMREVSEALDAVRFAYDMDLADQQQGDKTPPWVNPYRSGIDARGIADG